MIQTHSLVEKLGLVALAVLFGALAGVLDLTGHDVDLPALILLSSAFLLGGLSARLAWSWAVLIGLSALTACGLGYLLNIQPPSPTQWLPLVVLPLGCALAGSLAGAGLRWLLAGRPAATARQGE